MALNELQLKLIRMLRGVSCQCGGKKGEGKSFCMKCYKALTLDMKRALYKRVGDGYEAAYAAAMAFLGA